MMVDALFEVLQWTASSNRFCMNAAEKTLCLIAEVLLLVMTKINFYLVERLQTVLMCCAGRKESRVLCNS